MSRTPGKPKLILFQQMTVATARKAKAASADATSGGGARDIRLRPHHEVLPFMMRLLPRTRTQTRPDGSAPTIQLGTATWGDGSEEQEIEYWPPTNSRPEEGRITRISSLPPLANPPQDLQGSVVLFVQDEEGIVWVRYATATGLRASLPEVGDFIRACIGEAEPDRIASGYIDLTLGGLGKWCNYDVPGDDA